MSGRELWTPDRKIERVENDGFAVKGFVRARVFGPDGKIVHDETTKNIITQVGRRFLTNRALAITGFATNYPQISGAKLGQGTTAEAVTGAGAHIVTYITGSQKAIDGSYPTEAAQGNGSRITYQITWGAGVATNANINEVTLTDEATLTDAAGSASFTVGRAVISVVNKGVGDTLVVTWTWDIGIT